mmetsp:Transcript_35561/g.83067  ORF Transcript_35561/g.83067 Transcript_35561/m.83067 type:complete len:271 (+) Transcript_35561:167-979(+)|eukprot:CAMPEP_0178440188 /NCGR_PEP_ID=MMETSP0689_2-20121128/36614_1 /TAXON_ID=160604 /ORGANISM="Amphidinium massartii, Strain CS-259" /LENGTH=270 /DNA_ID=CAMNT_0020062883 /DNA_START=167 /DNA_END=979 /DNA_ORIENTATION=+
MSLAQLLSLGKKAEEEKKPEEKPEVEAKEQASAAAAAAPSSSAAATLTNEDELKVLQEFTQTQSKLSQEEAERRQAEEEKLKKQAIDDAARAAAELAKRQKAMSGTSLTNPFSTGGQEFTKGVFVCDTVFGTNTPRGARSTMEWGPGLPGMPAPGMQFAMGAQSWPSSSAGAAGPPRERSRSPRRSEAADTWSPQGGGAGGWGAAHQAPRPAPAWGGGAGAPGWGGCAGGYPQYGGGWGGPPAHAAPAWNSWGGAPPGGGSWGGGWGPGW